MLCSNHIWPWQFLLSMLFVVFLFNLITGGFCYFQTSYDFPFFPAFSRGRSVRQRIAAYSTAMEAIQAQSEPVEIDNDDVP